MVPVSELQRARKYPFSAVARNAVRQLAPTMNDLNQESFETALGFVEASSFTSPQDRRKFVQSHFAKRELTYPAFLTNDVLAFPLAKILLSYVRNPLMYERFASVVGDLTFEYAVNEKDRVSTILELAQELNAKMDVTSLSNEPIFTLSFSDYLRFPFKDAQLHLVNQPLRKGKVELQMNAAARWVAEGVHMLVLSSLPVDTKGLPPLFAEMSRVAGSRIQTVQARERNLSASNGILLQAFPPCMDKLHSEITSGVNLPHMARFDLATFLVNINMPYEDIVGVFSKASNYNEHTTRYHLDNLSGKTSGKKYSSPACAKVREHGLCISRTCNVTHPLQFYARESETPTGAGKDRESTESSEKVPTQQ